MPDVKLKIVEIFQKMKNPKTIPVLVDFLHHRDEDLVYAAVTALGGFTNLGENIFDQAFSRYRVILELKHLFTRTSSERVLEAIIRTLADLKYEKIVPFLLQVMKTASPRLYIACIQVCSLFHDPALGDYLLPSLKSNSPFVRAHAALALWQFPTYRKRLRTVLNHLLHSNKREDFLAYCTVIGDIGTRDDRQNLLARFDVFDPVLKMTIAYALYKLGNEDAVPVLVHLLFSRNSLVLEKAKELFGSLKPDQKKYLQNIVQRDVSQQLQPVFSSSRQSSGETACETLQRCKDAYLCLDLRNEAEEYLFSF